MKSVDPKVHELASLFVDDVVQEANRPLLPSQRAALVDRAAGAMQQAVEDECESIRADLKSGEHLTAKGRPIDGWPLQME